MASDVLAVVSRAPSDPVIWIVRCREVAVHDAKTRYVVLSMIMWRGAKVAGRAGGSMAAHPAGMPTSEPMN